MYKQPAELCRPSQKNAPAQKAEPPPYHGIGGFLELGKGLELISFSLEMKPFCMVTDYFSSFIEIKKVSSLRIEGLIQFCKEQFSCNVIPDVLSQTVERNFLVMSYKDLPRLGCAILLRLHHISTRYTNGKAESAVRLQSEGQRKLMKLKRTFKQLFQNGEIQRWPN